MVNLAAPFAIKPESSLAPTLDENNRHRGSSRLSSLVAGSWRQALGIISALTILTAGSFAGTVLSQEVPTAQNPAFSATNSTLQQPNSSDSGLAAGTYLYGDSSQGGVVGRNYLIFQVTSDHRVVGASYAPYSSFDCFHGQERAMQLELIIRDSYTRTQSTAAIPLSELKPISTISITDQQLLNTCRSSDAPNSTEANRFLSN